MHLLANDHLDLDFTMSASSSGELSPQVSPKKEAPHKMLLEICTNCLGAITSSLSIMPLGIRYIATILSKLVVESTGIGILSDFLFLQWIVNAFWNPGDLAGVYTISPTSRSNLEAVGTVLLKLMSGSRFSSFDPNLKSVIYIVVFLILV